jgi:hypothetical protein
VGLVAVEEGAVHVEDDGAVAGLEVGIFGHGGLNSSKERTIRDRAAIGSPLL